MFKSIVFALVATCAFAQEMQVSFSSKKIHGISQAVVENDADFEVVPVSKKVNKPSEAVSFSSARTIGGNWVNVPKNDGQVTFTSARIIGLNQGSETPAHSSAMAEARKAKSGVSFTSARQIGSFMDLEPEDKPQYTTVADATEEEKWAVQTATISTAFATFIFALIIGVILGVCCCLKCCRQGKSNVVATSLAADDVELGSSARPVNSEYASAEQPSMDAHPNNGYDSALNVKE